MEMAALQHVLSSMDTIATVAQYMGQTPVKKYAEMVSTLANTNVMMEI